MARTANNLATSAWVLARKGASVTTAVESALATTVAAIPVSAVPCAGWRGFRMAFLSNGANDETATITVYGIDPFTNVDEEYAVGYRTQSLGTLALTFGTSTLVAGTIYDVTAHTSLPLALNASYRWADTVVWTASTYGTALLTYVSGNAAAFSPADNTIGEFLCSDFGNFAYLAFVCTTYGLSATKQLIPLVKFDV